MKIDDKYKWLARDKDGRLCGFDNKPFKIENEWDIDSGLADYIKETDSTYSFIKWEDEEPYEIPRNKKAIQTVKEYIDSKVEQTKRLDVINKPSHYHSNGTDVIGFAEAQFSDDELKGFYRINAIKYLTRYDKKGTPEDDLQKADFYLRKLIELNRS